MGLRAQAAADLKAIVEDSTGGFGWPVLVTSPEGAAKSLFGLSTDVAEAIDPQTGQAAIGRKASVVFSMASLATAGLSLPTGSSDGSTGPPWFVEFADVRGVSQKFKIAETRPDRALGAVVCILEAWSE